MSATASTRSVDDVRVEEALPELVLPLTRTLIVATAVASRDYQDVHHDPGLAQERGSDDIFMNILTTNGLVGRYVTDWAGPGAVVEQVSIRLGAPNYPGDTMTMTGTVTAVDPEPPAPGAPGDGSPSVRGDGRGTVTISVRGANSRGDHVTGTVRVALPRRGVTPAVLPA
ncbi:MAG TPA: MaoC family dehydratase [Acidimicrobiales bacterium]|nr:MaoC family dehydratase [Acidimicrobiales bacterium]